MLLDPKLKIIAGVLAFIFCIIGYMWATNKLNQEKQNG